jgi:hypothetical protein
METPEYVRAGDARGIENGGRIGSHQRDGARARGYIALADAAIVERDGADFAIGRRAG